MKRLNFHHLEKLCDTNVPSPFPGKYPTRMAWVVRFQDGRVVKYFGKPNKIAAQKFLRLRDQPGVVLWSEREFDRGNVVGMRAETQAFCRSHGVLDKLYHPFRMREGIADFADPFYQKRISGFRVYRPYKTLKLQMLKDFKGWLEATGLVKGKAIPVSALKGQETYKRCVGCGWISLGRTTCPGCGQRL